jgi:outer membrane lipoprotein-sorting protein
MDLGTEFFHWPRQVLTKREMRKGRGCDVLESRPARPALYSRVVSWIDQETSGLLMAEAYDASGRLLKEFEVKGFKKVAGQWRVREMEIRNRQLKTATRLQFQFDAK